jgi:hypothetical protein
MSLAAGQVVDEDDLADIVAGTTEKPVGRLVQAVAQSIADNTHVALTFTTEEFDTHGFHSTSVNTSRVTPTIAGYYRVSGAVFMTARSDYSYVEGHIRVNGTAVPPGERKPVPPNGTVSCGASAIVECDGVSDYFEFGVRQDNTANVASLTTVSVQFTSALEWEFMRGL